MTISAGIVKTGSVRGGSITTWLRKSAPAKTKAPPCGTCNACCRAGYEVDLRRGDDFTLAHHANADGIPILDHAADGACVYLVDGACSVYERRPQACREYDCRAFAYSGLIPDIDHIRKAAQRWSIRDAFKTRADKEAHVALRLAAMHCYAETSEVETAVQGALQCYSAFLPLARDLLDEARRHPEWAEQWKRMTQELASTQEPRTP